MGRWTIYSELNYTLDFRKKILKNKRNMNIAYMIYHRVLLHSFDKIFMTKLENICLDLNDFIVNFMQYILISMKYCNM